MTGTRIWAFGTTIVIIAVLALGWLLGVSPMLSRLSAAELELVTTEANNQAQQTTLQIMKAQYEDLEALEDELDVLRVSIPGAADPEFVYNLLAGIQAGTQTQVSAITTGEPEPYGVTTDGQPTAEGVAAIANLYTVPVTITFTNTPATNVLAYAASLQRGPRLFLVTSITGTGADTGTPTATITAFMFVLADASATPDDAATALAEHPFDASQTSLPLGPKPSSTPTPTPTPSESPTPTGTPAP